MLGRRSRWPDFVFSQRIYYMLDLDCLSITLEFDCLQSFDIGGDDLVLEILVVVFNLFLEGDKTLFK